MKAITKTIIVFSSIFLIWAAMFVLLALDIGMI